MRIGRRNRTVFIGLGAAVVLAVGAWVAGAQIKSPAQVAAETAAPDPSSHHRARRATGALERGDRARHGPLRLAAARRARHLDAQAEQRGQRRHRHRHDAAARAARGSARAAVAMSVSGRPVFVLRGAQPSHRDIGPGSRGPGRAPARGGAARAWASPRAAVDGRYDGATGVGRGTLVRGRRLGAVRRDRHPARPAARRAGRTPRRRARRIPAEPGSRPRGGDARRDIAQARIDLQTARDAVVTARARPRLAGPRRLARARATSAGTTRSPRPTPPSSARP